MISGFRNMKRVMRKCTQCGQRIDRKSMARHLRKFCLSTPLSKEKKPQKVKQEVQPPQEEELIVKEEEEPLSNQNQEEEESIIVKEEPIDDQMVFECGICSMEFTQNSNLKNHLWTEHKLRKPEDSIKQEDQPPLKIPIKKGKKRKCLECDKVLDLRSLQTHIQKEHAPKRIPGQRAPKNGIKYKGVRQKCKFCPRHLDRKSMARHLRMFHENQSTNLDEVVIEEEPFEQVFLDNEPEMDQEEIDENNVHEVDLEALFECDTCQAKLQDKAELDKHMKEYHKGKEEPVISIDPLSVKEGGRNKFSCQLCDKTFTRSTDVKRHIANVHEKVRNRQTRGENADGKVPCHLCHKCFTRVSDLKRHLLNVHEGIKPIICKICQAGFSQITTLRTHAYKIHGISLENSKEADVVERIKVTTDVVPEVMGVRPTFYNCAECDFLANSCDQLLDHHEEVHTKA